eukprot:1095188-Pelagomonas_calceolata.AAC.6
MFRVESGSTSTSFYSAMTASTASSFASFAAHLHIPLFRSWNDAEGAYFGSRALSETLSLTWRVCLWGRPPDTNLKCCVEHFSFSLNCSCSPTPPVALHTECKLLTQPQSRPVTSGMEPCRQHGGCKGGNKGCEIATTTTSLESSTVPTL